MDPYFPASAPESSSTTDQHKAQQQRLAELAQYQQSHQLTALVSSAQQFTQHWPEHPEGWRWLMIGLHQLGYLDAALTVAQQLVQLEPQNPVARTNYAVLLIAAGRYQDAEQCCRDALNDHPNESEIYNVLGQALQHQQQFTAAIACYRQALSHHQNNAHARHNLAMALQAAHHYVEAEIELRQLIAQQPDELSHWRCLGHLLLKTNRLTEAEQTFRSILSKQPHCAETWVSLGATLETGYDDQAAEAAYEQALRYQTDSDTAARALSNLLFLRAYRGTTSPAVIRQQAEQWEFAALTAEERHQAQRYQFQRDQAHQRPLRIGLLSAELGYHPVAYFLQSWLPALNPEQVTVLLYPTQRHSAEAEQPFRSLAATWTPLAGVTDQQAVAQLRADHLDIVIETSGHTRHHRLGILAHRVAPIQCHYIGYFSTTGLSTMDYFIGDEVVTPALFDDHFCEQIWRLPRTRYAYAIPHHAPDPCWQPDPDGTIWLGSFNNLAKINTDSLVLWAQVMRALPNSKLLLKATRQGGDQDIIHNRIMDCLQQQGIDHARIRVLPYVTSWHDHMALYHQLDLALDTIPYNSATTGFDALWMGVPLLTLAGSTLAGRMAASLLTGLGRPAWIAQSVPEFVATAVQLAHNASYRQQLRWQLRQEMQASEVCDGADLARHLQETWRMMFEIWWRRAAL
jgi:predicted O-linked N-acetylglucosamine transferase (SPINDLY family)